jgi:hypothetical protein
MRTFCVKNGLVVAVVLLFVGISIKPAIAVNPISTDTENDCSICPKVSKLQLVRLKSLIEKLKINDNKLSVMSKHHPQVAKRYQEVSDGITTLTDMNKELKPDRDYPRICDIILILALPFIILWDEILSPIWEKIDENSLIGRLMYPFLLLLMVGGLSLGALFIVLDCSDFDPFSA